MPLAQVDRIKQISPVALRQLRMSTERALAVMRAEQVSDVQAQQPLPEDMPAIPSISRESVRNTTFYRRATADTAALAGDARLVDVAAPMDAKAQRMEAELQAAAGQAAADISALEQPEACETCAARVYQDGSDDSGVSYQSPKGMPIALSGIYVAAHEREHATREHNNARREGQVITDSHTTMQMRFCPDCGRLYAAGGATTIEKIARNEGEGMVLVENAESLMGVGEQIDDFK